METNQSKRRTFNVSFVCRTSKMNPKNGTAPVELCLNINGQRVFITLMRREEPAAFKRQMESRRCNELKSYTIEQISRINETIATMQRMGKDINVRTVRDCYLNGFTVPVVGVGELFNRYLTFVAKKEQAGVVGFSTWRKYNVVRDIVCDFIGEGKDCNMVNAADMELLYAELKRKYSDATSASYIRKVKTVFLWGKENGIIDNVPFNGIRIVKKVVNREYLTEDEVISIYNTKIDNERLERVRDTFIFQCYTSLSYIDMANLKREDILKCAEGYYIRKNRQKTDVEYTIYLSDIPMAILRKYNYTLPVLSNQKYNAYLKELECVCHISKRLHSHLARHTCATMLLNKGVSIEVVAKVLGHSNTNVTKVYAKMLDSTVITTMKSIFK